MLWRSGDQSDDRITRAVRFLDDLDIDVPLPHLSEQLSWLDGVLADIGGWGLEDFQLAEYEAGAAALLGLLLAEAGVSTPGDALAAVRERLRGGPALAALLDPT
ncbi:MAG: hypothetical protein JWL79_3829 [Frankiales bacterium]|nr:hypothetical protein [Frankiales bacterium]